MKVVINRCFGGFGLSDEAIAALDGWAPHYSDDNNRADERLVRVVETLGEKANGPFAKLKIVDVPDGSRWEIEDYDGMEKVVERHRSWT